MPKPSLNDKYPNKSKEVNLKITKNLVESLDDKTHFIFFSTDKGLSDMLQFKQNILLKI